ncbi:glucosamine-6-phosphate deaminase [Halalkalibacillus sediminis]|uniref:Glucosamine-6-phosphate deaminase n=1 Tax=Halalkalibacillus sediminis TaxID=2018042 RepID=A0A2I0QUD7_9BACI|nr:glucosamine-6-phosphate deaminase [Halalkalibacillus sediminis]PKR77965.1 glucosamine-6-phosphate deaminase [Halalkalibacillus sediminis]
MNQIEVNSYEQLSEQAAKIVESQLQKKKNSVLGLATGSTPVGMYKQLIEKYEKGDISFADVTSFNLDEYAALERTHPQSYFQFMKKHLFDQVDMKPGQIHIPNGTAESLVQECSRYEEDLAVHGPIDLQVLGLGINGHIGFNEPGTSFQSRTHVVDLAESTREANARFFERKEDVPSQAVTMGIESIMKSRKIILLAYGEMKRTAIDRLFYGEVSEEFPASILKEHPDVTVIYG